MESIESLRHQFDYNEWANQRWFILLKDSSNQSQNAIRVFAHLLLTEKMYLLRILRGEDTTGFDFWRYSQLDECEMLLADNKVAYSNFLRDLTESDLERVARYKNSRGGEYCNTFRQMLTHVLLHSTYHRGQVASAVRTGGGKPANTDYITYLRQSKLSK
jgi:uncharacterized damage-inducible protein DinB